MPSAADYLSAWEQENTLPYPRQLWIDKFDAPASAYPSVDFLPIDLSVVFTSYIEGQKVELYDPVDIEVAPERLLRLLVIGTVPEDETTWFMFNTETGQIMLLDIETPTLEVVNASFAQFADFLYHFALFIDADTGLSGRAERAVQLRTTFEQVDASALADPESWWSAVCHQLGAAD